jgi:hypothetical protein
LKSHHSSGMDKDSLRRDEERRERRNEWEVADEERRGKVESLRRRDKRTKAVEGV